MPGFKFLWSKMLILGRSSAQSLVETSCQLRIKYSSTIDNFAMKGTQHRDNIPCIERERLKQQCAMLKTKVCAAFKRSLLMSQTCSGNLRNEIQPFFTVKDTVTACNSCDLRFTLAAGIKLRTEQWLILNNPLQYSFASHPNCSPKDSSLWLSLEKPIFPLPDAPHSSIWASFS